MFAKPTPPSTPKSASPANYYSNKDTGCATFALRYKAEPFEQQLRGDSAERWGAVQQDSSPD